LARQIMTCLKSTYLNWRKEQAFKKVPRKWQWKTVQFSICLTFYGICLHLITSSSLMNFRSKPSIDLAYLSLNSQRTDQTLNSWKNLIAWMTTNPMLIFKTHNLETFSKWIKALFTVFLIKTMKSKKTPNLNTCHKLVGTWTT
jgi:hypothetical protein